MKQNVTATETKRLLKEIGNRRGARAKEDTAVRARCNHVNDDGESALVDDSFPDEILEVITVKVCTGCGKVFK